MQNASRSEKPWYTPMLVAFLSDDCPRLLSESSTAFARDVDTLVRRLSAEGESFITKTLPTFGKSIDLALQGHMPLVCTSFKKRGKSALPAFLQALLRRVFLDDGWVREQPCILSIRLLRQICFWCKKIEKGYSDESLRKALADFIAVDRALPAGPHHLMGASRLLAVSRAIVEWCLRDIGDPSQARPGHGPGSVASGVGVVLKRKLRTRYIELERVFRPLQWFFSLRDAAESPQRIYERVVKQYGLSRVAFVEKDSFGPRTISLEPEEYMWVQQGMKTLLYDYLQSTSPTRGHVNFDDQSINRELAKDWIRYDTLDMSKASDRNSLALFCWLFSGTRIYPWLLASRTPGTVLPDGRVLLYRKFAPMGSAVCFPVQALTYYALACAALHLAGMPLVLAYRSVYVYGDDLVVPHGYYPVLNEAFESVGLKFNTDKCCIHGKFRESCGLDAFDGQDVTPVRIRKNLIKRRTDVVRLVEHTHSLANAHYWSAADALRKAILATYPEVKKLGIKRSPRSYPFLTWPSMDGADTVKRRHNDGLCRASGWSYVSKTQQSHRSLEMQHLHESLACAGPVGSLRLIPEKEGSEATASVRRVLAVKYRGSLLKRRYVLGQTEPPTPLQRAIERWAKIQYRGSPVFCL